MKYLSKLPRSVFEFRLRVFVMLPLLFLFSLIVTMLFLPDSWLLGGGSYLILIIPIVFSSGYFILGYLKRKKDNFEIDTQDQPSLIKRDIFDSKREMKKNILLGIITYLPFNLVYFIFFYHKNLTSISDLPVLPGLMMSAYFFLIASDNYKEYKNR